MIKIRYFGMLAEVTHCSEESLDFSGSTVDDLLIVLAKRYPKLNGMNYQVAMNNNIVDNSTEINAGEIALLPPFAGG